MVGLMARTFGCTGIADTRAKLESFSQDLLVGARPPNGEFAGRFAQIGTVKA